MARTFFAGQDYTFIAGVSNETNDNLKKKREAKFGYTVDDGPMQDLVDGNGKPVEAVIVGDMLEITVQFPETLIGKKVRLYAYVRKQENGKSFEIEVLENQKNYFLFYPFGLSNTVLKHKKFEEHSPMTMNSEENDPIDPRTGLSFDIDLWRDGVVSVDAEKNIPDKDLKSKIKRDFLGIDGFPIPRTRNSEGGNSPLKSDTTFGKTSEEAKKKLEAIFGTSTQSGSPCDRCWNEAANSGSYTFSNSVYAESEWLRIDLETYKLIQVEDNIITKIVELELNTSDEYEIKKVITFEITKGETSSRIDKNWLGTEKEIKHRNIAVIEKTQYYKNNVVDGDVILKKYNREILIP